MTYANNSKQRGFVLSSEMTGDEPGGTMIFIRRVKSGGSRPLEKDVESFDILNQSGKHRETGLDDHQWEREFLSGGNEALVNQIEEWQADGEELFLFDVANAQTTAGADLGVTKTTGALITSAKYRYLGGVVSSFGRTDSVVVDEYSISFMGENSWSAEITKV